MAKGMKEQKQEIYLSVKETADKLRALADDLEKGIITVSDKEFSLTAESGVKINFKSKGNKVSTKIKFNSNVVSGNQTERSPAKNIRKTKKRKGPYHRRSTIRKISDIAASNKTGTYKDLKKRMSQDFSTIMRLCIRENKIPDANLMERFYKDSKAMCDFPGMGEEFYREYLNELEIFYQAYKDSGSEALRSSIMSLNRIKKTCHDKYK